jgi:hypothetical protein
MSRRASERGPEMKLDDFVGGKQAAMALGGKIENAIAKDNAPRPGAFECGESRRIFKSC